MFTEYCNGNTLGSPAGANSNMTRSLFLDLLFTEQIVLSLQQKRFAKLSREHIHGHWSFVSCCDPHTPQAANSFEFHFRRAPTHIQHKYQSLLGPHESIFSCFPSHPPSASPRNYFSLIMPASQRATNLQPLSGHFWQSVQ